MTDVYYQTQETILRRSKPADVDYLSTRLRQSDIEEIWASHHVKPYQALYGGFVNSIITLTIEHKEEPLAMFGISPYTLTGDKATIWMLSTDRLDEIKGKFLKNNRKVIDFLLGFYPYLENYVDERNIKSINWLKFCGAKIEEAKPFGLEGLPFHHFYFERK